jgi:surfactin synthase thioesterase subunit
MPRFPLVLLPHAGGSVRVFDRLVAALPAEVEPISLELPGRGRRWREPLLTCMDDVVEDLEAGLGTPATPFAIFGHSLGAYLGLALAARLERNGAPGCTTLFASANAGPARATLPFVGSPLLTTDEEILAIAGQWGGVIAPEVWGNRHLRERTSDLLRADFSVSHSFLSKRDSTVTEADIVVCCGDKDVFTDAALADWRLSSTGSTEILRFPGDHFYLEEQAPALATAIAVRLGRWSRRIGADGFSVVRPGR